MKKFLVLVIVLMTLLSTFESAFNFWQIFRSTTGFSTAIQVPATENSYHFDIGDTLLLPSGKEVKLLEFRSDNKVEVSVSGGSRFIGLNDYEVLNDVRVFFLSKLSNT